MTAEGMGGGWRPHADETYVSSMGRVVERHGDGGIEIGLHTDDRHRNLSGAVHGGVMMTLVDRAIGINCRALSPGDPVATATLTVNFLRPVRPGDFIEVACTVGKKGRKAIFANAQASVDGRIVATATGICMKTG